MKRRKVFIIDYEIEYNSGKKWRDKKTVCALSKFGAEELFLWMMPKRLDVIVLSITDTGRFTGNPIWEDRGVLGNF